MRHPTPPDSREGHGRAILVADDDPIQRKLVRIYLEQLGFRVTVAEDGEDALEKARISPPDAIISDMLMPRMDGFKLCLNVRQDPRLAHIPVVLTSSAFVEEADRKLAESVGASAFIPRTPDMSDVIDCLFECLGSVVPPRGTTAHLPTEEYAERLSEQLGRQVVRSTNLAARLEWMESKLQILSSLAESLKQPAATQPLTEGIMHRVLEALAVSRGAAYLKEDAGALALSTSVGYQLSELQDVGNFFGHSDFLQDVLGSAEMVEVHSELSPGADDLLRRAGSEALLVAPLMVGGEGLGVLALSWTSSEREVAPFLPTVLGQVSQTLALVRALSGLRANRERLAFLARAGAALAESLDYETILATVPDIAVPELAELCLIHALDTDGRPRLVASAGTQDLESERMPDSIDAEAETAAARVLRSAVAELNFSAGDAPVETGHGSAMVVPLLARGRVLATATFVVRSPTRRFRPEDLATAEEFASRAALALDNARLYEDAKKAIKARDDFLSIAAHELKTPITSLRGFAQITAKQLQKKDSVDEARLALAMKKFDQQSQRLAALVEQLLSLSRLEAGRLTLRREDFNLDSLVREAVESAGHLHPTRSIQYSGEAHLEASLDSIRMEQVITNLLDNAVKFSPKNTPVEIDLRSTGGGWAEIAVRDYGEGVPEEIRERIFERYYQAHGERHTGGMGLGLYLSRQIVGMHGGSLRCEDAEGGGSRFVLRLPLSEDPNRDGRG